jgi:small conductance mechanosensitive channel
VYPDIGRNHERVNGCDPSAIVRGGKIDATTSRYITSILSALLTIGLVLGIFGYLGVQTTSFAALLAGVGLAIGTAWGGLLAHLASGLFMQIMRPFKVGDYVVAGGIEGTVTEMIGPNPRSSGGVPAARG